MVSFFDRFKSKFEQLGKRSFFRRPEIEDQKSGDEIKLNESPVLTETEKFSSRAKFAEILRRPLVTEKTAVLAHQGQYVFVVHPDASKIKIAKAIKVLYGVEPQAVRIMARAGKVVRFGRLFGRRRAWKKAIIILPAGKPLPIYE